MNDPQNGMSTKELLVEVRTDVKKLLGFMEGQIALKHEDRLCELEDKRIPKIESWQWRTAGALAVVSALGMLVAAAALRFAGA